MIVFRAWKKNNKSILTNEFMRYTEHLTKTRTYKYTKANFLQLIVFYQEFVNLLLNWHSAAKKDKAKDFEFYDTRESK